MLENNCASCTFQRALQPRVNIALGDEKNRLRERGTQTNQPQVGVYPDDILYGNDTTKRAHSVEL